MFLRLAVAHDEVEEPHMYATVVGANVNYLDAMVSGFLLARWRCATHEQILRLTFRATFDINGAKRSRTKLDGCYHRLGHLLTTLSSKDVSYGRWMSIAIVQSLPSWLGS